MSVRFLAKILTTVGTFWWRNHLPPAAPHPLSNISLFWTRPLFQIHPSLISQPYRAPSSSRSKVDLFLE